MDNPWITALAALFLWWFATSTILIVVSLCERWSASAGRRAVVLARGLARRITLIEGTLGKAYGCMGGYVTGAASLCDFIRSFASGFIFPTPLPLPSPP